MIEILFLHRHLLGSIYLHQEIKYNYEIFYRILVHYRFFLRTKHTSFPVTTPSSNKLESIFSAKIVAKGLFSFNQVWYIHVISVI